MSHHLPSTPASDLILYSTEDGLERIEVRLEDETVWLSQAAMAELFDTTVPNINMHLKNTYDEGELDEAATVKDYLIVRSEGTRVVRRSVKHYNLEAIIAVGYRVRSRRGTQFRLWATERLREFLVKGFAMDDERLKAGSTIGSDYFDELLGEERATYGKEIVSTLSRQLTQLFGRGFGKRNLHRMVKLAVAFSDEKIVTTLSAQLGWSHS